MSREGVDLTTKFVSSQQKPLPRFINSPVRFFVFFLSPKDLRSSSLYWVHNNVEERVLFTTEKDSGSGVKRG